MPEAGHTPARRGTPSSLSCRLGQCTARARRPILRVCSEHPTGRRHGSKAPVHNRRPSIEPRQGAQRGRPGIAGNRRTVCVGRRMVAGYVGARRPRTSRPHVDHRHLFRRRVLDCRSGRRIRTGLGSEGRPASCRRRGTATHPGLDGGSIRTAPPPNSIVRYSFFSSHVPAPDQGQGRAIFVQARSMLAAR